MYAYITNLGDGTVSVINTSSDTVTATVNVGTSSESAAVSPDGATVYVANNGAGTVSVINTSSNTVTATVTIGSSAGPDNVVVSPDGTSSTWRSMEPMRSR